MLDGTAKRILTLALFATFPLLSACQNSWFPSVYRINIQQGNVVEQRHVDQLKPGMTQRQVRYILGNPLVLDSFNPNRWDYYYSLKRADGQLFTRRFSVFFENDTLVGLSGDFVPGGPEKHLNTDEDTTTEPEAESANTTAASDAEPSNDA